MSRMRNCVGCDEEPGNIQIQSSFLVSKMFSEVTGALKINPSDSLCKTCQAELKKCYNFRRRVQEIHSLYENVKLTSDDSLEQIEFCSLDEPVKQEGEVNFGVEILAESSHNDETVYDETFIPDEDSDECRDEDEKSADEMILTENQKEDESWCSKSRFSCPSCSKTFDKQSALKTHELSHLNLRNFACPRSGCNAAFNVLYRLIRHMRNVHSVEEDEIDAVKEYSRKDLTVKSKLPELKPKTVAPAARVQCSICLKNLSNMKYLKEHMTLQHLDNAPHVCEKPGCGKKFTDWSLLEKHQKKHEGKFEFQCSYCSKGFVQRKILNQHLKKSHQITQEEINQMQKLHKKCAECGLTFKTSQKLSEHRAFSHGAGNIFCCDFCGKLFFSRVMLISHQKYHQVVKKKKCLKCPSEFIEEKGLKTHLRRVHKMSENDIFEIFMKK